MIRIFARFKSFFLALVLLSISFSMMFSKVSHDGFQLRTLLFSVTVSIERTFVILGQNMQALFTGIQQIRTLEERLANLEQRIQTYRELALRFEQAQKENERYRRILDIQERISERAMYARIIFRDPSLLADTFVIDKGRANGVKQNMPVVSASSNDRMVLVGRIIEVGRHASKAQMLSSKNFYIGARLVDAGYTGVIRGQGAWNQNITLDYIPIEANPVVGEEVLTSGESEIYPEGLLVGKVRGIGQNRIEDYFQILYIQPELDYTKLTDVFILNIENKFVDTGLIP